MPTYDYECTNCKGTISYLQSIKEESKKKCPNCKKNTLQKIIYPCGVAFKGSGFYETDYKNK